MSKTFKQRRAFLEKSDDKYNSSMYSSGIGRSPCLARNNV